MTLSLVCFPNDGIQGEQSKCVGNTAYLSSLSYVLKKIKMGIATRGIKKVKQKGMNTRSEKRENSPLTQGHNSENLIPLMRHYLVNVCSKTGSAKSCDFHWNSWY